MSVLVHECVDPYECIDNGAGGRWHVRVCAAFYLDIGVRTFVKLKVPPSEKFGRRRYWSEQDLDQFREKHGPFRRRGRPAEFDYYQMPDGTRLPFHKVNYYVTREVLRRVDHELIVPEWREHHAFAFGVADVIGLQPSKRHRLETIEPGDVFGPSTVLWWKEPSASSRKTLMRELTQRSKSGDTNATLALVRLADQPPAPVALRRLVAADQRWERQHGDEPQCYCLNGVLCHWHEAAIRAGADPNMGDQLPENGSATL